MAFDLQNYLTKIRSESQAPSVGIATPSPEPTPSGFNLDRYLAKIRGVPTPSATLPPQIAPMMPQEGPQKPPGGEIPLYGYTPPRPGMMEAPTAIGSMGRTVPMPSEVVKPKASPGTNTAWEIAKSIPWGYENALTGWSQTVGALGESMKEAAKGATGPSPLLPRPLPQWILKAAPPEGSVQDRFNKAIAKVRYKVGDSLLRWGKEAEALYTEAARKVQPSEKILTGEKGVVPKYAAMTLQAIPPMMMAWGVAYATGNPFAGGASFTPIILGPTYWRAREKGVDSTKAMEIAVADSAQQSVLETAPIMSWMKGGKPLIRVIRTAFQEGLEEVFQQAGTNALEMYGWKGWKDGEDFINKIMEGVVDSGIVGFLSGGLMGTTDPTAGLDQYKKTVSEMVKKEGALQGKTPEEISQATEGALKTVDAIAQEMRTERPLEGKISDEVARAAEGIKTEAPPVPPPPVSGQPIERTISDEVARRAEVITPPAVEEKPQPSVSPPLVQPEGKAPAKEVWQRTRADFENDGIDRAIIGVPKEDHQFAIGQRQNQNLIYHKQQVGKALYEGKPVPPSVLADYPELVKKYGKAPAKEPWEMTPEETGIGFDYELSPLRADDYFRIGRILEKNKEKIPDKILMGYVQREVDWAKNELERRNKISMIKNIIRKSIPYGKFLDEPWKKSISQFLKEYQHPLEGIKNLEIKEKGARKLTKGLFKEFRMTLSELIDAPELFKKYPKLKNVKVGKDLPNQATQREEYISIGKNVLNKEVIAEEITHYLRGEHYLDDIFREGMPWEIYSGKKISNEVRRIYQNIASEQEAKIAIKILEGTYDKEISLYGIHKEIIERALLQGKPVPPSVLADYPELATKYGKAPSPEPAPPSPAKEELIPAEKEPLEGHLDRRAREIMDSAKVDEQTARRIAFEEAEREAQKKVEKVPKTEEQPELARGIGTSRKGEMELPLEERPEIETLTRIVKRIIDTSKLPYDNEGDNQTVFGSAAWVQNGIIKGIHVTSDPEPVTERLKTGKSLMTGRGGLDVGDIGGGLYMSAAPQMWMSRATAKWDFLKELTPNQKTKLADRLETKLNDPDYYKHYLTESERAWALKELSRWRTGEANDYAILSLADQPYNFSEIWKKDYLAKIGVEQKKMPIEIPMEVQGKFAELDRGINEDDVKKLRDAGYDGAFLKGGFAHIGQLVVWNNDAVTKFGDYRKGQVRDKIDYNLGDIVKSNVDGVEGEIIEVNPDGISVKWETGTVTDENFADVKFLKKAEEMLPEVEGKITSFADLSRDEARDLILADLKRVGITEEEYPELMDKTNAELEKMYGKAAKYRAREEREMAEERGEPLSSFIERTKINLARTSPDIRGDVLDLFRDDPKNFKLFLVRNDTYKRLGRTLKAKGQSFDRLVETVYEAGYLRNEDPRELLGLIRDFLSGRESYPEFQGRTDQYAIKIGGDELQLSFESEDAFRRIDKIAQRLGVKIESIKYYDREELIDPSNPYHNKMLAKAGYTPEEVKNAIAEGEEFSIAGVHKVYHDTKGQRWSRIILYRGHTPQHIFHEFAHAVEAQGGIPGWVGTPEQHATFIADALLKGEENKILELTEEGSKVSAENIPRARKDYSIKKRPSRKEIVEEAKHREAIESGEYVGKGPATPEELEWWKRQRGPVPLPGISIPYTGTVPPGGRTEIGRPMTQVEIAGMKEQRQATIKKILTLKNEKGIPGQAMARIRSYLGITELKKARPDQLNVMAEFLNRMEAGDKFLSEKALKGLSNLLTEQGIINAEVIPTRILIDKLGEKEDILSGIILQYIPNELMPTVDIKQGHPLVTRMVNTADWRWHQKTLNVSNRNERFAPLIKKAEKARAARLSLKERAKREITPIDLDIFRALSGQQVDLTKEEAAVVAYYKNFTKKVANDLQLEKRRRYYVTHLEADLLEKMVRLGPIEAVKSLFVKPKQTNLPIDIFLELDNIIGSEKFFRFALERKGGTFPTLDMRRIIHEYSELYETKKALDEILPEAQQIVRKLLQPKTAQWARQYLQSLKGRGMDFHFRTGKAGWLAQTADRVIDLQYIKLLSGNIFSGAKNLMAGEANIIVWEGVTKFLIGNQRLISNPRKAYKMASEYGALEGTFAHYAYRGIGRLKKTQDILMVLQQKGEEIIRPTAFLGELTKNEWESGKISVERYHQINDVIAITQGKFTQTENPLLAKHWYIRSILQMNRWRITDAMMLRRMTLGAKEELSRGVKYGPNMQRLVRAFIIWGISLYLARELGRRGYKKAASVARSMGEAINNTVELLSMKPIYDAVMRNPTLQMFGEFCYDVQRLASYVGLTEKPIEWTKRGGLGSSHIALKQQIKSLFSHMPSDKTDAMLYKKAINEEKLYYEIGEREMIGESEGLFGPYGGRLETPQEKKESLYTTAERIKKIYESLAARTKDEKLKKEAIERAKYFDNEMAKIGYRRSQEKAKSERWFDKRIKTTW